MVWWGTLVAFAFAAGCGRFGFEPVESDLRDASADAAPSTLAQRAYLKASNPGAGDFFGAAIALSGDGSTLAVGATSEDSAATGVDGDQADNTATTAGAVYVFRRIDAVWIQQAYIKPSNTASDEFGYAIALSADGSTLAVSALLEDSAATGIGGNQADNTSANAGAVYVYTRAGTTWTQQAYVKASNTGAGDTFGSDVALSADGSTLAVGASREDSAASGVGGNQDSSATMDSGAVYVFTRAGTSWSQQAYVKASNPGANDRFGDDLALSADGATLVVAALLEDSAATGIDGNQADDSAMDAGAVYVFTRAGTLWTQQAYVKASNTGAGDTFGEVALSGDGSTLAVGATAEASAATGIGGNQGDNASGVAGAVYVFTRAGTTWTQEAYVKASNTGANDWFGLAVALSADGSTLAVGASSEDSAATGVGGDQTNESAMVAGAIYMFERAGTTWTQHAYVKASNTGAGDQFGGRIALSADSSTLVAGAAGEDSAATGVDGDQADNTVEAAGAAYLFESP
jgi:hypothetical protein